MLCVSLPSAAQDAPPDAARRKSYDELLDLNVRDGLVYYRALRAERGRLDAYVSSLANASIESAPRDEQIAFWFNAYNALVLKTVVDHYPIPQRTAEYPTRSIRQIPGAFERTAHRVAGRMVTLDQIEQTILSEFHDPRLYLALGRGAIGGGRLRSEALQRGGTRDAAEGGGRRVRHPRAVYRDRSREQSDQRQPDLLLALAGVHRRLRECRAGAVRHPQPDRARHPRRSSSRISSPPSGSSSKRTSSRSSSSPSTGRSTT